MTMHEMPSDTEMLDWLSKRLIYDTHTPMMQSQTNYMLRFSCINEHLSLRDENGIKITPLFPTLRQSIAAAMKSELALFGING